MANWDNLFSVKGMRCTIWPRCRISPSPALATGTHGSGDGNGNLATAVAAMEVVTADGEVVEFSRERDGPQFQGIVIGLGAFGVITKLHARHCSGVFDSAGRI